MADKIQFTSLGCRPDQCEIVDARRHRNYGLRVFYDISISPAISDKALGEVENYLFDWLAENKTLAPYFAYRDTGKYVIERGNVYGFNDLIRVQFQIDAENPSAIDNFDRNEACLLIEHLAGPVITDFIHTLDDSADCQEPLGDDAGDFFPADFHGGTCVALNKAKGQVDGGEEVTTQSGIDQVTSPSPDAADDDDDVDDDDPSVAFSDSDEDYDDEDLDDDDALFADNADDDAPPYFPDPPKPAAKPEPVKAAAPTSTKGSGSKRSGSRRKNRGGSSRRRRDAGSSRRRQQQQTRSSKPAAAPETASAAKPEPQASKPAEKPQKPVKAVTATTPSKPEPKPEPEITVTVAPVERDHVARVRQIDALIKQTEAALTTMRAEIQAASAAGAFEQVATTAKTATITQARLTGLREARQAFSTVTSASTITSVTSS